MIRLENLALVEREKAQTELEELGDLLRTEGLDVEVAGPDEPFRARLEESIGGVEVDVLNVILDHVVEETMVLVVAAIRRWAKKRRWFRGEREGDRPQARLWIVEDGREREITIELDS